MPRSTHASEFRRSAQWHLRYLNVHKAQEITRGAGVTVAVPDTGVFPHPDLKRNLLPGTDSISGSTGNGWQDLDGHGTGMAGLIAANGGERGVGALGIAPEAKILPIRGKRTNLGGDTDNLAAGIEFAISHGADVISISAVASPTTRLQQAVKQALQNDIVVVAGAGNAPVDSGVGYPASEPDVIAVGGIDRVGKHANVSVTGPELDLAAPSVDIYSTSINGGYRTGTGTSDATAIVAGAAALIRSKYPDLPAQEVAHRLTATAIDKGPPGRDDEYGYGVIDLVAALTAGVPPLGFESSAVTAPASSTAAEPASGDGDGGATARGLATLGVLTAAGGGYLLWRRRRRADDPPPRISR
ncbi:type VII secretion-associated serine protease mycosin [Micromonospora sp. R77]|uniref:type VII secretion-associated serine protease mycosin n=1 Tax=Micromonospora sp. R77 TaxID=2925836 RepID=UPI001F619334|nr:type VII secretion-associated serine protease mycosin [Micromonospora sp. R77]MCI4064249.1 type VII secretion-associated serine protease mycosin [Micromonospora sp. R77]